MIAMATHCNCNSRIGNSSNSSSKSSASMAIAVHSNLCIHSYIAIATLELSIAEQAGQWQAKTKVAAAL